MTPSCSVAVEERRFAFGCGPAIFRCDLAEIQNFLWTEIHLQVLYLGTCNFEHPHKFIQPSNKSNKVDILLELLKSSLLAVVPSIFVGFSLSYTVGIIFNFLSAWMAILYRWEMTHCSQVLMPLQGATYIGRKLEIGAEP